MADYRKPASALRRARELYANNNKQLAIETLYDIIKSRRHKTWTATHEEIMEFFIVISVDMKKNTFAKDGLHQYRSICQHSNTPNSLAKIVKHFLNLAEKRCALAASQTTFKLEASQDLDEVYSAETIMLTSVSVAGDKERVERETLVPWLRFLHESYRTVLNIIGNNNKLERVYHETCKRAYNFCVVYERKQEFRRICQFVKKQLNDIEKYSAQDASSNRPYSIVLSNSVYEKFLDTKFEQLKTAIKIGMLNEGYKTICEIHEIIGKISTPLEKDKLSQYYSSLTEVSNTQKRRNSHLLYVYSLPRQSMMIKCSLFLQTLRSDEEKKHTGINLHLSLTFVLFKTLEPSFAQIPKYY